MFEDGPNPTQVQLCPPAKRADPPTPIVLLHDGGGTTFSYFILGSLGREVWAIHDPKYFASELWEGGVEEMANHYIELIEKAGIKGPVFLGGWSLGGYTSLQIARIVADRTNVQFSVAGLLLIDSPFQYARSNYEKVAEPVVEQFPDLIQKSFDNCDTMLHHWDLPKWDGPTLGGKTVTVKTGGHRFDLDQGKLIFKPLNESWKTVDHQPYQHEPDTTPEDAKTPPPGVLIRATQRTRNEGDSIEPSMVDMYRDEPLIGWEVRHPDFLKAVIEYDSHHYNMFDKYDDNKSKTITANVKECLEVLDSLQPPKPKPKQMPMMDFF